MLIPTEDKLFDHDCQFKDMKLSAFNPKSLTYYCQICGGKFIIEKDMKDWKELFGEPITLKLNKKVLKKAAKARDIKAQQEEAEILEKEQEAMKRAEEARNKAEEARQKEEDDKRRQMEELQLSVAADEKAQAEAEEKAKKPAKDKEDKLEDES